MLKISLSFPIMHKKYVRFLKKSREENRETYKLLSISLLMKNAIGKLNKLSNPEAKLCASGQ